LFIGSALLVISWSIPMPVFAGDWASVLVLISSATVIGFLGSLVPSNSPKTSFRAYGITLGAVALVGIGVMSWQQTAWYAEFSDSADTPYKLVGATDQPMKNYVRPVQVLRQPNSPLGSPPNTTRTTPHGVATKLYPPLAARSPTVSSRTTPRASFWWLILMQAMPMTNVILTMIAWKRVYGKQQD
ncbi:MAG: hypothetical protein AB8B55_12825, partial [Mariniblastus sp.]